MKTTAVDRILRFAYLAWAIPAISIALLAGGGTPENLTRILVLVLLIGEFTFRRQLSDWAGKFMPRQRFLLLGLVLASIVEGFHMISTPVFLSLRISPNTAAAQGLKFYLLDLVYTLPAYVLIFSVIYYFAKRCRYSLWQYILIMGLGQVIGDGGLFYFFGAPGMLIFLPYPMSNYHAVNVLPYLAVEKDLPDNRAGSLVSKAAALPAIILTYLVCGALIKIAGKPFGLQ